MHALIIDDSQTYLSLIDVELQSMGYTVDTVKTLREAIEKTESIDLLICDIYMPQESVTPFEVVSFAQKVRAAVILTVSGATDVGADIVKGVDKIEEVVRSLGPNDLQSVLTRLNALIERWQSHHEKQQDDEQDCG